MNYIEVEHPHGFLIWRGKQKAIANNEPLPTDTEMLLICNGEGYGKLKLSQPAAVTLSEFDRFKDDHAIRVEERKMMWPDDEVLYIHRISDFEPFSGSVPVITEDGQAEFVSQPADLNKGEARLVSQAEKLPKQIILCDDGLILDHDNLTLATSIDYTKALQAYEAAISDNKGINGRLPLYRLALVRQPHLIIERTPKPPREEADGAKKKQMEGDDMPYTIERDFGDCSGYAVVKETDSEVMGCHETREEAEAQLTALNIAEAEEDDDEKAEATENNASVEEKQNFKKYTYNGISVQATGRRSSDRDDKAWMRTVKQGDSERVVHYADPDMPMRRNNEEARTNFMARHNCDEKKDPFAPGFWACYDWANPSEKSLDEPEPDIEETEPTEAPEPDTEEKAGRRIKKSWRENLRKAYDTIKEMLTWADYDEGEEDKLFNAPTGFAIKEIDGKPWFYAWSTNAFVDREQEIFSTKSLEQYVAEAERLNDRGFFNVWHIPGTDFAEKQWQGVIGRFLVEAGPFLDTDLGRAALKFFGDYPDTHPTLAPEGWGMSPEYRYLPEDRDDKIYDWIWITRSSVLGRAKAANIFTRGGLTMALTDEQKQAAEEIFGEGLAARIITEAETESKKLEEAGIAHKSNGEEETEPADAEQPEEAEEKAQPETETVTLDGVVAELVKQLDLSQVVETVEAVSGQVAELGKRLDQIEKGEKFKEQDEMPRYVLQLKRASEAEETQVQEGDELREKQPRQAKVEGSLANNYFKPVK